MRQHVVAVANMLNISASLWFGQAGDALRILRLHAAGLEEDADADVRRQCAGGDEREF